MAFHEVQLDTRISYGARGGPGFNTAIVRADSVQEERVERWGGAVRNWDIAYGVKNLDNGPSLIIDFHVARAGAAHGFRFKDHSDFSSSASKRGTPADTDQVLGFGDGVTTTFQLRKAYTSGGHTVYRSIEKPVAGSVVIARDAIAFASSGNWTVNTTNGVVTFNVAPGSGVEIAAGFLFDTPVRFGDDTDKQLPLALTAFQAGEISPITIVELRNESLADEDYWFGGGKSFGDMTANVSITELDGRVLTFNPTTVGRVVTLPNPAALEPGGPKFYIVNLNATNTLAIHNHLGAVVGTLAALGTAVVVLGVNAAAAKTWYVAVI